jgi:hypothetical protein
MNFKIVISLLFILSSSGCHSESKSQPQYIFKLGTSLFEVKRDSRFSNCKFKDNRPLDFQEANGPKTIERFVCPNTEKTKELSFSFYNQRLVAISANFHSPSTEDFLGLMFSTDKKDIFTKKYRENFVAIHEAITDVCKSVGPSVSDKADNSGNKAPNGAFYINFTHTYSDNKEYKCIIMYQKRERWNESKKANDQWQFPQSFYLINVPEIVKAQK